MSAVSILYISPINVDLDVSRVSIVFKFCNNKLDLEFVLDILFIFLCYKV